MIFTAGVLIVHFNAIVPPALGNTNWISAWTVDPATGALAHLGVDIDIGAANTGHMTLSADKQTIYLPRQGNFSLIGTGATLTHSLFQFPQAPAGACVLPPAGAGTVLADPNGKAIYLADPVGAATGNIPGAKRARLSSRPEARLRRSFAIRRPASRLPWRCSRSLELTPPPAVDAGGESADSSRASAASSPADLTMNARS